MELIEGIDLPYAAMTIYETISFIIFGLINVGSLIASTIFAWWFFKKLKDSRTVLKDFIGSVALAKLNLVGWSGANLWAMTFSDSVPPLETLPFRVGWLIVIYIQVRAVTRIRPAQSADMIVEMITNNRNSRILVLEDDPDVAELYKLALSDFGFDVVVAGTGSYALSVMDWQMPKVCIVDIGLPDMTGYQFLATARLKGYTGPAIAVSGRPLDKENGFGDLLIKPFRPAELVALVEKYVQVKKKLPAVRQETGGARGELP